MLIKASIAPGSRDDSLDRASTQCIVATSGFSESERPAPPDWLKRSAGRGIKLFRQDQTGAVQLRHIGKIGTHELRHWRDCSTAVNRNSAA